MRKFKEKLARAGKPIPTFMDIEEIQKEIYNLNECTMNVHAYAFNTNTNVNVEQQQPDSHCVKHNFQVNDATNNYLKLELLEIVICITAVLLPDKVGQGK